MTAKEIAKMIDSVYPDVSTKDLAPWILEKYDNSGAVIRQLYAIRERRKIRRG